MHDRRHPDMLEATRLVRAGKLTEATALLQRALRSGMASETASRSAREGAATPAGRGAALLDMAPDAIEITESRPSSCAGGSPDSAASSRPAGSRHGMPPQPHLPAALRGLLGRIRTNQPEPGAGGHNRPSRLHAPEIVPAGGLFLEASYGNQAGSRAYKLYVPSGYRGQAVPMVIMLHGCTQSPDDFAAGTRMNLRAEEKTCLVAYPAQAASANASRCWNWFRPSDQHRGQGEPSLIAGITWQIMRDYSVDPERVYVAGLSAGAAAAAIMGMTYPDLYAAIGVHSGLAYGVAGDLPSAFAAMRQGEAVAVRRPEECRRPLPTIVFHGDQDSTVHPRNGDQVIAQSRASATPGLRTTVEQGRVPGGHAYSRTLHNDVDGRTILEQWVIHGTGHAWSGGSPAGSYTDPQGPDATREMLRFFLEHRRSDAGPPFLSD